MKSAHCWINIGFLVAVAAMSMGGCSGGGGGGGGGGDPYTPGGWTKFVGNPVITPLNTWDLNGNWQPFVLKDGATYHMWYNGDTTAPDGFIGYASSIDSIVWTRQDTTPVLAPTIADWDDAEVADPCVIKNGLTFMMWYTGTSSSGGIVSIGLATSTDGANWTKSASSPVLAGSGSGWDAIGVGAPCVILDGSVYKMWYSGIDVIGATAIGYATSTDGINWTRSASNPVLTAAGASTWEGTGLALPRVVLDGSFYRMWYTTAPRNGVGYASSVDGVSWTKFSGNPVVVPGPAAWENGNLWGACVILDGTTYKMWYGAEPTATGMQIGYATK